MFSSLQFDIYPKVGFFLHNTYLNWRITFSVLFLYKQYHLGFYFHFEKRQTYDMNHYSLEDEQNVKPTVIICLFSVALVHVWKGCV